MQVADSKTPTTADIKRQLGNTVHELEDLLDAPANDKRFTDSVQQSLYRVLEALTHIESAEKIRG